VRNPQVWVGIDCCKKPHGIDRHMHFFTSVDKHYWLSSKSFINIASDKVIYTYY